MQHIEKLNINEEWLAFINNGSMLSLSSVYNRHFNLLFDYGRKFTSDNYLIEDAIQNIFINLINAKEGLKNVKNAKSYLVVSFRNELFRLIKRVRKVNLNEFVPEILFVPDYSDEDVIEEEESSLEMRKILQKCLHNLTSKQKEILFLRYDAGLSYEEISKVLGISIESSRTSVYRAIKSIKEDVCDLKIKYLTVFFAFLRKLPVNFRDNF